MTSFLAISLLGLFLGMRHATDPDHVIAVSTIVSRQQGVKRAGLIGVIWGLGHTFTIFLVGAAIILFKVVIPARLGLTMELSVGLMLILLGSLNLTGTLQRVMARFLQSPTSAIAINSSDTIPGGRTDYIDRVAVDREVTESPATTVGLFNLLRPLVVGIIHGLAGSAAVALLVMTTIRDPWGEIGYLLVFGLGTVLGMMMITALIALPFVFATGKISWWNRGMSLASGLVSVGFGLFLSYRIGIVDGLFAAHPHWTPQ